MNQQPYDADALVFIKPYDEMVESLFKVGKELGNEWGDLMHAAVGIAGECGELFLAIGRNHQLEEAGDLEFYLMAAHICARKAFGPQYPRLIELVEDAAGLPGVPSTAVLTALLANSTMLLDICKKGWVYNKPVDMTKFTDAWLQQRHFLNLFYHYSGIPKEVSMHANQMKLIGPNGRYPHGTYSDAAAQARADKGGQEG